MKRLLIIATIFLLNQANAVEIQTQTKDYPIDKLKEQNSQIVKMVVEEVGKTLPQQVDKYTKITKLRDENLTLIYTFEINSTKQSDQEIKQKGESKMKDRIIKGVCKSSKRFIDSDISLIYEYISAKSKQELFSFKIDKKVCKELDVNY